MAFLGAPRHLPAIATFTHQDDALRWYVSCSQMALTATEQTSDGFHETVSKDEEPRS